MLVVRLVLFCSACSMQSVFRPDSGRGGGVVNRDARDVAPFPHRLIHFSQRAVVAAQPCADARLLSNVVSQQFDSPGPGVGSDTHLAETGNAVTARTIDA